MIEEGNPNKYTHQHHNTACEPSSHIKALLTTLMLIITLHTHFTDLNGSVISLVFCQYLRFVCFFILYKNYSSERRRRHLQR